MTPALEVEGLEVAIGGRLIVRGLSFEVQRGAWFGLLGANGSGKTTLLRALCARLDLQAGAVRLSGADVAGDAPARAAAFGFAPPPDSLPSDLYGRELLDLLGRARRVDPRTPRALYAALDISWLETVEIAAMSAGMRQRLAVFTAFIGEPQVILLDEPFNWLDPVAAYELKGALRNWTRAGGALVTALHDISTFAARCDEGLLLHEGRVVRAFGPDEITAARGDILGFEKAVYEGLRPSASGAGRLT